VIVRVTVAAVAPLALRRVIGTVADPGRSARICQATSSLAPAAIGAAASLPFRGVPSRIAPLGVKVIITEFPGAIAVP
jgi:hypothetical protein